jgi:hypothetical protein
MRTNPVSEILYSFLSNKQRTISRNPAILKRLIKNTVLRGILRNNILREDEGRG